MLTRIVTNTVVVLGALYAFHVAMRMPGKHLDEPTSEPFTARLAIGPLDMAGARDFAVPIARAATSYAAVARDPRTLYAQSVTRMEKGIDELIAVRILESAATPCDNGPNSADATSSPSVCRAVITRVQRDGQAGKMAAKACLPPAGVDPARLQTTIHVDFAAAMIEIASTFDGVDAPECRFDFGLPLVFEPETP